MLSTNLIVKALLVVILASLVGDANLLSENQSGLRGTVVYKVEHVPLRNVYIFVHRNGETDKHVRTDESGKYSVQLSPGIYDVFVSADGFAPTCRKVEIEPNAMMVLDAALEMSEVGAQE